MLKRVIISLIAIFVGIVCNAQLNPPVQVDTLCILSVKYNHMEIRKENWPCTFIYKSTTSFNICDREFTITGVSQTIFGDNIYFALTDKGYDTGEKYVLTYSESDSDGQGQHPNKIVCIDFSGYEFLCRYFSAAEEDARQKKIVSVIEENSVSSDEDPVPFQLVEEKPLFNGGSANLFSSWVNWNLVYPEAAKEKGVQGRVTLQFTIDTDGSMTDVTVLESVSPELDAEAVRVVSSSPKWTPGKQNGKSVKVILTFPVIFQLR